MANKLSRSANIGLAFGCVVAIFLLLGLWCWWLFRRNRALSLHAPEERKRTANERSIKISRALGRAELGAWIIGEAALPARPIQTRQVENGTSTPDSHETWRMSSILEAAKDDRDAEVRVPPPAYTRRTVPAYTRREPSVEQGPDGRRWDMPQMDPRPWNYMGAMMII